MRLAHRLGESLEQLRLDNPVLGQAEILGGILKHQLRDRQHDRQLRPGQAAIFLGSADQLFARAEALDLPVEPSRAFEQFDRTHMARQRLGSARFGDRKR